MSKINIVLDASMYDMFLVCAARFNYRYNMNKILPEKEDPLERGTLVHLANETYYEGLKAGVQYQDAVNASLMKVKAASVIEDVDEAIYKRVVEVMEEYFDYWRFADQNFQIVDVEKSFIYLLYEDDNIRIHMSGKIDLLVSDNKYTNLPYDHKSYQRKRETTRMSNQFKNYAYATKSNFLIVNKIGFQKTLKPEEKFVRVPLSFDHIILGEWRENVVKNVYNYLGCVNDNSWPMNETSCDKFNRQCEYFGICDSSGIQSKKFKLENEYILTTPWDVTTSLLKTSELLDISEKEKK